MTVKKRNRKNGFGFTMIEVMAVLVILGLLGTLVVTKVASNVERARETITKSNLKIYHTAVSHFRMDTGRLPTEEENLMALIEQPSDAIEYPEGGYLEMPKLEQDGWKHDFIYELDPGSNSGFLIRSCGPDGEPDTEDDLVSTELN
ncbi:MAG: type II secretion system major pseudopilin GspG [Sedimentisphaerales bacterium]|nr:type II secretion system major pseudopilin GspG [Sedimentisphaerales bacterium]